MTRAAPVREVSIPAIRNARTTGSAAAIPMPVSRMRTDDSTMAVGVNHGHTRLHRKPSYSPVVASERINENTACFDAAYAAGVEGDERKEVNEPVRMMEGWRVWGLLLVPIPPRALLRLSSWNACTARCVVYSTPLTFTSIIFRSGGVGVSGICLGF